MRVIIMLRPTNERGTKTAYTKFRKRLASEGFTLLQPEVFIRAVTRKRTATRLIDRISEEVPNTGAIWAFTLTEKQYAESRYLCGGPGYQEQMVGSKTQVVL